MKYLKYLKYVLIHKWFVFLECWKYKKYWLGIIHDWSKFRLSEFIPYARYFYGLHEYPDWERMSFFEKNNYFGLCRSDIERRFDKAWLYHQHRNKHHWQFYLLQEDDGPLKNLPIPIKYLKEMVADWRGASKAITGKDNTQKWYEENKDKINLNRINRAWVEKEVQRG